MTTQQNQYDQPRREDMPSVSTQLDNRQNYTRSRKARVRTNNALLFWAIVTAGLTFLILVVTIASWLWTMLH